MRKDSMRIYQYTDTCESIWKRINVFLYAPMPSTDSVKISSFYMYMGLMKLFNAQFICFKVDVLRRGHQKKVANS